MLYHNLCLGISHKWLCFSTRRFRHLPALQRRHFSNHHHIKQTSPQPANTCQSYLPARPPTTVNRGIVFCFWEICSMLIISLLLANGLRFIFFQLLVSRFLLLNLGHCFYSFHLRPQSEVYHLFDKVELGNHFQKMY